MKNPAPDGERKKPLRSRWFCALNLHFAQRRFGEIKAAALFALM